MRINNPNDLLIAIITPKIIYIPKCKISRNQNWKICTDWGPFPIHTPKEIIKSAYIEQSFFTDDTEYVFQIISSSSNEIEFLYINPKDLNSHNF